MGESGILSEMERKVAAGMIRKIADNIISPLGDNTAINLDSVMEGRSMLSFHEDTFGLPEAFCASLIDRESILRQFDEEAGIHPELTYFEKIAILSAERALRTCDINPADTEVVFVLSTTKGNVDLLQSSLHDPRCHIGMSAKKIARYFGNSNTPIVASNACISGVCAQMAAIRELLSGRHRYAVVIGTDVLSKFIISGFQSFKALSIAECKPYDKNRNGLNLGEAAGTIVLEYTDGHMDDSWQYVSCSNHNDANHISGPSRTGEGSYRVLKDILEHIDSKEIAFINTHGTATAYNDEMESIAIHRAGLIDVPVNGMKGYYGHTLGAAGVIETILSMAALDGGIIPATRGFEHPGTTYPLNLSNKVRYTDKRAFIKLLSGFGGSNAAICWRKGGNI